jgi:hypothetical protein
MNAETPTRGEEEGNLERFNRHPQSSRRCATPAADDKDCHPDGRLADLRDLGKE